MFQAYIDDSGKGGSEHFVLAGYIAQDTDWRQFSLEWQQHLEMNSPHYPRLDYFKMVEMRSSPERRERAEWFYRIIEKHVFAAVSCSVPVFALAKAVDSIDWPSYVVKTDLLKNPYYFSFKAIIDVLAQNQEALGIDEPVSFIFDENHEKKRTQEAWDLLKVSSKPEVRKFMGEKPQYKDDKQVLPLQATDMYAYWVRYWDEEGIADGIENLKFGYWNANRDIPRLAMSFSENDIRSELEKGFNTEAIKRAQLSAEEIQKILNKSGDT